MIWEFSVLDSIQTHLCGGTGDIVMPLISRSGDGGAVWIVPASVLAVLIGFSRLYLYVHYPTDVLAGAVLGALPGWVGCALVHLADRRFCHRDHSPLFRS